MIAAALAMLAAAAAYVRVRWMGAPAAFRAMSKVGIVCVLAGILIGYGANHLLAVSIKPPWKSAGESPPDPTVTEGKVPALDVGKSIVLTDEKHSGDPMWTPSSTLLELCPSEGKHGEKLSSGCLGAYLGRHALGKDLDRGPKDTSVALDDVAELCDNGEIEKDWPVCVDAYTARHAKMK